MPVSVFQARFTQELYQLLDETFKDVHGIYLDKGTSLGETLAGLTAGLASQPISPQGASIASHVGHVLFYLDVVERGLRGEEVGPIDWEQSWLIHEVTPEEWTRMQDRLEQTYHTLLETIRSLDADHWEAEDTIGDALSSVVHTAYHLGAIRLALRLIKI